MVLITVLGFFVYVGPIQQVMPAIAAEHGEGAAYLGVLLSAMAVGGISANPLVRRLIARGIPALLIAAGAVALAGVLMVLLALSSGLALDLPTLFVDRRGLGDHLGDGVDGRPLPQPGRAQRRGDGPAVHDLQPRRRRSGRSPSACSSTRSGSRTR